MPTIASPCRSMAEQVDDMAEARHVLDDGTVLAAAEACRTCRRSDKSSRRMFGSQSRPSELHQVVVLAELVWSSRRWLK